MATDTKIPWAHDTRNFWWGCFKWSEACEFCYAEEMDKRRGPLFDHGKTHWGKNAPRWLRLESAVKECEQSNRAALKTGRRRVFVNSMSDTFEDHPALPEARTVLFATIERLTACDWLLLTKRPENIRRMVPAAWLTNWPAHVWVGATAENQHWLQERWKHLMHVPAPVVFFSCEPMLGRLTLRRVEIEATGAGGSCFLDLVDGVGYSFAGSWPTRKPQWVIIGGESGSNRKFCLEHARELLADCQAGNIAPFMKQLGCQPFSFTKPEDVPSWANQNMDVPPRMEHLLRLKDWRHGGDMSEWPADLRVREFPTTHA